MAVSLNLSPTPDCGFLDPPDGRLPRYLNLALGRGGGEGGIDDFGRHSDRPTTIPQKLSILHLEETPDFLAGSKCGYRKNIKTIFFGMEYRKYSEAV